MPHEVQTFMYDISNGMARALGPLLLGQPIEAVWHTAVVAFGREYLFVGNVGIESEEPEQTHFGKALEKLVVGTSTKTQAEFEAFNAELQRTTFGPDDYNLIERNCNHYTDAALFFLTGQRVPEKVSAMTATIFGSPLGRIAKQVIETVQQQMVAAKKPAAVIEEQQPDKPEGKPSRRRDRNAPADDQPERPRRREQRAAAVSGLGGSSSSGSSNPSALPTSSVTTTTTTTTSAVRQVAEPSAGQAEALKKREKVIVGDQVASALARKKIPTARPAGLTNAAVLD
ncbi:putative endo-beta-N-acetylglucosaminidase [Diplonema papillatum]|nr:putative endo-beta-N-acetylglucosaminidase [Diplonema papillatum]